LATTEPSTHAPFLTAIMSVISTTTHQLLSCSIFSKIDLVGAYDEIPVQRADIQRPTISTPFDLFDSPFMSFGQRNAAQTFQRFTDIMC
jgi:hypothetical protein